MLSEKKPTIKMIVAMLISGTIGVFVVESGESVYNVVFFRCLFGALMIGAYAYWRGFFTPVNKRELSIILIGGAAIVINWVLLFKSYQFASIGVSTITYHTQPFFVLFFAMVLLKEQLDKVKILWVPVAFVGVVLIIDPVTQTVSSQWVHGMLLALLAAVFYALATVVIKMIKDVSSYTIVFIQLLLGIVLLAPLMTDVKDTFTLGLHWLWLLGLGALHTCVMYVLMYDAFKKLPSVKIAVLAYIYPVAAVLLDYFVYGKELTGIQMMGMFVIIVSGFMINNGSIVYKKLKIGRGFKTT